LEEARAVGALAAEGWKPQRTIVYAAWDAEEPGLLGSTEWAEEHADELRRKAVVYVNTDSNSRGFLWMGGSHTLERLMNEIAGEVEDPQTGASVAERARARLALEGGARHFLLVSALGADPESRVFYSRVKGELERAVLALGYPGVTIVRPSLLLGDRQEFRLGEEIAKRFAWATPRTYRPVEARDVAATLVDAAREDRPGPRIIESAKIGHR